MEFHVFTTHRGPIDETPLHMISAHQLAYYQQVEADYLGLLQRLAEPADEAPDPALPPPHGRQHAPCSTERDRVARQHSGGCLAVKHAAQELSEGN